MSLQAGNQPGFLVFGGSTPQPLYEALSNIDMEWSGINVALVDERWVEETDSGSNAAFIRRHLLQNRAGQALFTGIKKPAEIALDGRDICELSYQKALKHIDLVVLGMGSDGHTASLFPGADGLEHALTSDSYCAHIRALPSDVTGHYLERMTLTLHGILQSKFIILLITGNEKLNVYRRALRQKMGSICRYQLF